VKPNQDILSEQHSRIRNEEEFTFRRRFVRGFAILLLALGFLYVLLEHYFHADKIMAVSRNMNIGGQPTIKIRELHSFIGDDNPPYRFEYYCYSYPEIWSCQSYTGKSYMANSAQIEWASDGTATVSLDHDPLFTCKNGLWSTIRR
jgi:hypothetical protein